MRLASCTVDDVATMRLGLESMKHNRYDIVVWGVPVAAPEDRRDSIAEVKLHSEAPLVLLCVSIETAQQDLEAGADQWLPKPFVPGTLVGALTAALRNASSPLAPAPADVNVRGMRLQPGERTLLFKGISTVFTRQEWELLTILIEHPNRYLTTREVLRLGWHAGAYGPEAVRIYMRRLRVKMAPLNLPCELHSRHGQGYCLKFAA